MSLFYCDVLHSLLLVALSLGFKLFLSLYLKLVWLTLGSSRSLIELGEPIARR